MLTLRPGVRSSVTNSQLQLLLSSTMSSPGRLASGWKDTAREGPGHPRDGGGLVLRPRSARVSEGTSAGHTHTPARPPSCFPSLLPSTVHRQKDKAGYVHTEYSGNVSRKSSDAPAPAPRVSLENTELGEQSPTREGKHVWSHRMELRDSKPPLEGCPTYLPSSAGKRRPWPGRPAVRGRAPRSSSSWAPCSDCPPGSGRRWATAGRSGPEGTPCPWQPRRGGWRRHGLSN